MQGAQQRPSMVGTCLVVSLVALSVGAALTLTSPPTPAGAAPRRSGDVVGVYAGELSTINYLVTASTSEQSVAANTIDTLVEYDHLGIMRPALATSWEVSPDGLTWTFHLRRGVMWLTHQGKEYAEVTAQDWVDALRYSFDPANASLTANVAYRVIKNGERYFKGEITDFNEVGVKALDRYTLQYTLERPVPYFLSMLTYTHDPPSRPFLKVSLQVHAEAARAPRVARLAFPPDDAGRSRMRPTRSASQAITCAVGYGTAFWSSTDSLAA